MTYEDAAWKRLLRLLRNAGLVHTLAIVTASFDDRYLNRFDRAYGIVTSGFISLEDTSFKRSRLRDATLYGPVNGWGFRRLLHTLNLPRDLHFVDFGCGLGRACILAAEYGFERVTGVELAPEFCVRARENVASCRPPGGRLSPITILEMDALDYCEQTEDDVFFMFRPFSRDFFCTVLRKLSDRAQLRSRALTVIYSERLMLPGSFARFLTQEPAFTEILEATFWGQTFYVYQCGGRSSRSDNFHPVG